MQNEGANVQPSSKPVVLLFAPLPKAMQERLARDYRLVTAYKDYVQAVQASGLGAEARAAVTQGGMGISRELLALAPQLRLVCAYGAGYDKVEPALLKERGIALTNAAGANAPCVADMAMALLLASSLRVLPADRLVRAGGWTRVPPKDWPLSPGFGGKRMGIFGLGAIGLNVARRATPFDIEIGYHNRRPRTGADYRYFDNLRDMAEWCDYLVVAAPLSPQTEHAVNAEVLRALGPQGHLVNVGRGAIVDQPALIAALRDGVIAGAGLDVVEGEPAVPPELLALPNLVVTPHIGAVTERALEALNQQLLGNLEAFFAGRPLLTPVALN
jgi:lactate dehydrogenase-like 2-hydroxyacid dehydrogenase